MRTEDGKIFIDCTKKTETELLREQVQRLTRTVVWLMDRTEALEQLELARRGTIH